MLILYLIPFLIDCILIFNFLTYDMKVSDEIKSNVSNIDEYKDKPADQINELDLNSIHSNDINEQDNQNKLNTASTGTSKKSARNFFSSFISFKRTKNLTRTVSLNMFIYNLYFLEMKFYFKNFKLSVSGIPVTILVSFPSLILFIRYCKSRYEEWQYENQEVSIED